MNRRRFDWLTLFADIGYAPHPGQMLVHNSKARRRVLACGVRWGKTLCAAMEAVAALLEPSDGTIGWTVAPTLELSELVFARVVAVMQRYFKHRIKEISLRERRLVVVNFGGGLSELRGKSADAPDSLLGEGLDFLITDETARMKPEIWLEHLSQRLIDKHGWALLISTPGDRGWFWKVFRRGLKGRDAAFESWNSPSWSNPHLSRELIDEERKRLPKEMFESQFGGEFQGHDTGPCETCGAPDPKVPSILFGTATGEFAVCDDCGWRVDANGHTLVTRFQEDGTPNQIVVIVFENRPDGSDLNVQRIPIPGTHGYALSIGAEPALPGEELLDLEHADGDVDRPEGEVELDL